MISCRYASSAHFVRIASGALPACMQQMEVLCITRRTTPATIIRIATILNLVLSETIQAISRSYDCVPAIFRRQTQKIVTSRQPMMSLTALRETAKTWVDSASLIYRIILSRITTYQPPLWLEQSAALTSGSLDRDWVCPQRPSRTLHCAQTMSRSATEC